MHLGAKLLDGMMLAGSPETPRNHYTMTAGRTSSLENEPVFLLTHRPTLAIGEEWPSAVRDDDEDRINPFRSAT